MDRKDKFSKITITKETKAKIIDLANKKGLKQVTVLEYLLCGKIPREEL